jgi:glycosyltransferase involved in cell wall biosynthesis
VVVESGVLRTGLAGQGVDVQKVIVAHNAVEPREFVRELPHRTRVRTELGVSDDTILVGYLGSYAFYHDAARLVLAADLCRNKKAKANLKFLMVGAGKEYSQTHELAVKLGLLDELLVMKPGVPSKEVPGILAALDIAVLPGSTDIICPVKVQEYMACELPVVLPDYSCNREVVRDCETGFFFEPKNAASLAETISSLAANSGLRRSVGERARAEVLRRFTWETTWGAALTAVLDAKNGSPARGTPGVSISAKN